MILLGVVLWYCPKRATEQNRCFYSSTPGGVGLCRRSCYLIMAQDFAKDFYNSPAWKHTRKAYTKYQRGLCERCLAKGLFKPGELVHHKQPLTPENISDPGVALSFDNLQLLCRDCHAVIHKPDKRYKIDELGRITIIE